MKLSIIIPVYNEKKTLLELLKKVEEVDLKDIKKEIVIIDDGSIDNTKKILNNLENKYKIFYHEKNKGKGAAIKTALKHVTGDIIIIQDADLEYNPEDYKNLIKPIIDDGFDVVYGSRFLGKKKKMQYGNPIKIHYIGNWFLTLTASLLYNIKITDMETGYKVFKREVLKDIRIDSDGFDFEPEITAKLIKKKIEIKEIPINYFARNFKEGKKINWKDGVIALLKLVRYRFF